MNNIRRRTIVLLASLLLTTFLEMRFIEKESKPLKLLIRDALIVYFSVIVGHYLLIQINPIIHSGGSAPQIFTDNPDF